MLELNTRHLHILFGMLKTYARGCHIRKRFCGLIVNYNGVLRNHTLQTRTLSHCVYHRPRDNVLTSLSAVQHQHGWQPVHTKRSGSVHYHNLKQQRMQCIRKRVGLAINRLRNGRSCSHHVRGTLIYTRLTRDAQCVSNEQNLAHTYRFTTVQRCRSTYLRCLRLRKTARFRFYTTLRFGARRVTGIHYGHVNSTPKRIRDPAGRAQPISHPSSQTLGRNALPPPYTFLNCYGHTCVTKRLQLAT